MPSTLARAHHRNRRDTAHRAVASLVFASALTLPALPTQAAPQVFTNPILQAPAQDPQVIEINGRYYYCESLQHVGVYLRVADNFVDLAAAPRVPIWTTPGRGAASHNIWAPELHMINGRFYIYFAADDGKNENHRMWVLVSRTSDPLGQYDLVGPMETGGWAIDGTVVTDARGESYFLWSGWPGAVNGQQNLYISRMASPTELTGERVLIAEPDQAWERKGMPICEGPQVLQRDGKTFVVYSASGSWTEDYCLGMLVNDGGDFMNPASWRKTGQVFGRNENAWGVGHCGFITTPEGEEWMLYHVKTSRTHGWDDREVRAQRFTWTADGLPHLGEPIAPNQQLARPDSSSKLFPIATLNMAP